MIFYSFDDYWKQFGKFHNPVIINDKKLEQSFYDLAKLVWEDAGGTEEETYDNGHIDGFEAAEEYYKIKEENKIENQHETNQLV